MESATVNSVMDEEEENEKVDSKITPDFCFDYLGIHQLYAYIDVDNTACHALFKACSFEQVGQIKDWMHGARKQYRDVWLVQLINQ